MQSLIRFSNFGNNAAALEKTLRLAQSLTLIGGSLQASVADAAPYVLARSQFNLSRRFLRLHKWIDNFNAAGNAMSSSKSGIPKLLETAKFTFLGLYFFMEMFTITDVMGLTKSEIGPWLSIEGNRMWFYGLVLSILQALYEGLLVPVVEDTKSSEKAKKGKQDSVAVSAESGRRGLPYRQLAVDSLDILIPGAVIQVIAFSPLVVGVAMALSTLLQIGDMWPKIQAQAMTIAQKN